MKKIIVPLMLLVPVCSFAQQGEYCSLRSEEPEKIVHVNNAPQFFAKVKAQGDYIFYISQHEGNHLLSTTDTNDQTRDLRIIGDIDPVPSPDGRILTIPGVSIYLVDEVIAKKDRARPFYQDSSNDGVYQSVALVKVEDDSNVRTYRVVVDGNSRIQYRDYKIDFNHSPPKVTPQGDTRTHCPNQSVSTIMVSKTGRYVTGFDTKTNTTKIFDMTDLSSPNRCRELYDLGYGTGKIEFNIAKPRPPQVFNFEESDQRLSFHMDYFDSNVSSYFSGVESSIAKDVYTMDLDVPQNRQSNWKLKPSNLRKLFSEVRLGSGGYYPSFNTDGQVVMIYDDAEAYSFRFYNPERTKPYDFFLVSPASTFEEAWRHEAQLPPNWKERFHRAAAIGVLWSQVCLPEDDGQRKDITAVGASSYFLGMTKDSCTSLVTSQWDNMKPQIINNPIWGQDPRFSTQIIQGYGQNDLLQACGAIKDREAHAPPVVIGTPSASHLTRDQLVHHYCMGCHVPGGRMTGILGDGYPNAVDFTRTESGFPKTNLAHLLSSRRRINTGRAHDEDPQGRRPPDSMPPVNSFEPADRTDFDHGESVLEIINADITSVTALPKRVPLYLRGEGRQQLTQEPGGAEPSGSISILADNTLIDRFTMPPVRRGESTQTFEIVNGTNEELSELGANQLRGAFFYPGRNLFPGSGGTCGSTLAANERCKFVVGFAPPRPDMFLTNLTINYVVVRGNRRQPASIILPIDGSSMSSN
jgi:hypothetical protein